MKPITCLLSIVFMLGFSACNKEKISNTTRALNTIGVKDTTRGSVSINIQDTTKSKVVNHDTISSILLNGKWKIVGNMISAGGPLYFVAADGKDYVDFNTNGTMSGSAFPDFIFYTIKDNVTINMTKVDKSTYENYYCNLKGDTLSMSPAGPVLCIEGCTIKLVKD